MKTDSYGFFILNSRVFGLKVSSGSSSLRGLFWTFFALLASTTGSSSFTSSGTTGFASGAFSTTPSFTASERGEASDWHSLPAARYSSLDISCWVYRIFPVSSLRKSSSKSFSFSCSPSCYNKVRVLRIFCSSFILGLPFFDSSYVLAVSFRE